MVWLNAKLLKCISVCVSLVRLCVCVHVCVCFNLHFPIIQYLTHTQTYTNSRLKSKWTIQVWWLTDLFWSDILAPQPTWYRWTHLRGVYLKDFAQLIVQMIHWATTTTAATVLNGLHNVKMSFSQFVVWQWKLLYTNTFGCAGGNGGGLRKGRRHSCLQIIIRLQIYKVDDENMNANDTNDDKLYN